MGGIGDHLSWYTRRASWKSSLKIEISQSQDTLRFNYWMDFFFLAWILKIVVLILGMCNKYLLYPLMCRLHHSLLPCSYSVYLGCSPWICIFFNWQIYCYVGDLEGLYFSEDQIEMVCMPMSRQEVWGNLLKTYISLKFIFYLKRVELYSIWFSLSSS